MVRIGRFSLRNSFNSQCVSYCLCDGSLHGINLLWLYNIIQYSVSINNINQQFMICIMFNTIHKFIRNTRLQSCKFSENPPLPPGEFGWNPDGSLDPEVASDAVPGPQPLPRHHHHLVTGQSGLHLDGDQLRQIFSITQKYLTRDQPSGSLDHRSSAQHGHGRGNLGPCRHISRLDLENYLALHKNI